MTLLKELVEMPSQATLAAVQSALPLAVLNVYPQSHGALN